MPKHHLSAAAIRRCLALRDLTDPGQGAHAIQSIVDEIETRLRDAWGIPIQRERAHPVVSVEENYDRLLVPAAAVARDARYTRYLNDETVLRTHTSAMIPAALEKLSGKTDVLISCPGLVYRRDSIDRRHIGEPHQIDLWRIRTAGPKLQTADLMQMIDLVVDASAPGRTWRVVPAEHTYTVDGLQIDVLAGDWVEVGECGMANPALLSAPTMSGLAMGLGLDRLLMIRKGIDDIRLLRSTDPRVGRQMLDLTPYNRVSAMPPVKRDLSVAVAGDLGAEEVGDRVRMSLGDAANGVEQIEMLSETDYEELPPSARERLGIRPGQKNLLIRVVIRDLERTLTDHEANLIRDRIYAAVHEGEVQTWAVGW